MKRSIKYNDNIYRKLIYEVNIYGIWCKIEEDIQIQYNTEQGLVASLGQYLEREYWIVDPKEQIIFLYSLPNRGYIR